MIPAKKSPVFEHFFHLYNRQLLKRHFHGIYVKGPHQLPENALFYGNHSSWWDGLVWFHLNKVFLHHNIHIMMHEKGLNEFRFFKKLGAYSVNRNQPRDIALSLQYGAELLNSGKSTVLFPQGDEKHQELRPLGFLPGIVALSEKASAVPLLPAAVCYTFGHQRKQAVYISLGEPHFLNSLPGDNRRKKSARLEQDFTSMLDELRSAVISEQTDSFHNIL